MTIRKRCSLFLCAVLLLLLFGSSALAAYVPGSPEEALLKERVAFLGTRYGGNYVEYDSDGKPYDVFLISQTDESPDALAAAFEKKYPGVPLRSCVYSYQELNSLFQTVGAAMKSNPDIASVYVDVLHNRVVVEIIHLTDARKASFRKTIADSPALFFCSVDGYDEPTAEVSKPHSAALTIPEEKLLEEQIAFLGGRYGGTYLDGESSGKPVRVFLLQKTSGTDKLAAAFQKRYPDAVLKSCTYSMAQLEYERDKVLAEAERTPARSIAAAQIDEKNNRLIVSIVQMTNALETSFRAEVSDSPMIVLRSVKSAAEAQPAQEPDEEAERLKAQIALLGDRYAGHRFVGEQGRRFPVFYVKKLFASPKEGLDEVLLHLFQTYDNALVQMVDRSLSELKALKKQADGIAKDSTFRIWEIAISETKNRVEVIFQPETAKEERACFLGLMGNPEGVVAYNQTVDETLEEFAVSALANATVYSGPSTDKARAKVLGTVKKSEQAPLYGDADDFEEWYCIRFGDGIGYVKKQYFTAP